MANVTAQLDCYSSGGPGVAYNRSLTRPLLLCKTLHAGGWHGYGKQRTMVGKLEHAPKSQGFGKQSGLDHDETIPLT
jgi:hypothetical protein